MFLNFGFSCVLVPRYLFIFLVLLCPCVFASFFLSLTRRSALLLQIIRESSSGTGWYKTEGWKQRIPAKMALDRVGGRVQLFTSRVRNRLLFDCVRRNSWKMTEILYRLSQPVNQFNVWFPAEFSFRQVNPWLSPGRIIRWEFFIHKSRL